MKSALLLFVVQAVKHFLLWEGCSTVKSGAIVHLTTKTGTNVTGIWTGSVLKSSKAQGPGLISTPNIAYIQLVYVYMYKCRRTLPHHSKKLATKSQTDLRLIGFFLATQYWCSRFSRSRDGPLEKLWGRGGEFSSRRNFFSLSNSLYEFFRP